jgi:hypothetical protein
MDLIRIHRRAAEAAKKRGFASSFGERRQAPGSSADARDKAGGARRRFPLADGNT